MVSPWRIFFPMSNRHFPPATTTWVEFWLKNNVINSNWIFCFQFDEQIIIKMVTWNSSREMETHSLHEMWPAWSRSEDEESTDCWMSSKSLMWNVMTARSRLLRMVDMYEAVVRGAEEFSLLVGVSARASTATSSSSTTAGAATTLLAVRDTVSTSWCWYSPCSLWRTTKLSLLSELPSLRIENVSLASSGSKWYFN